MNKKLIISFLILLISFSFLIVTIIFKNDKFVAPEFDKNAIDGVPEISEDSYTSFNYLDSYKVFICGEPKLVNNKLYLYLTSEKSNDINLKARMYKDDKLIGETGLLKPNQYLEYVDVSSISVGDKISIKIMSYDDNYQSAGVIKVNLNVK